jgi:ubiquitin-protein ligase E3 D
MRTSRSTLEFTQLYIASLLNVFCDWYRIIRKYPGFPQAEHLSYPMNICHRLAVILKESNMAYPEDMRVMTGFEVGFLQRL